MKRSVMLATLLAGVSLASAAMADDDGCRAPMANWQPRATVEKMAEDHGWTDRRIRAEGGCYAVQARDAEGRRVTARIDPTTLKVLRMEREGGEHEEGEDDDGARGPKAAPAGTAAPPSNGLFRKGGAGVIVK